MTSEASVDTRMNELISFVASATPEDLAVISAELDSVATNGQVSVAREQKGHEVPASIKDCCDCILGNLQAVRYPFSILIASDLRKATDPGQDIRIHQSNLPGGYSNRSFDQRFVTPVLKAHGFTHSGTSGMESGRNLERPHPFTLDFEAQPRGKNQLEAFLGAIDFIENGGKPLLVSKYLLINDPARHVASETALPDRIDESILSVLSFFQDHHRASTGQGKSRLPVLSLFVV